MEQYDLQFVDRLFKEYLGKQYLAVKECGHISFPRKKKSIKKIAMQYHTLSIGGVERVISLLTPIFLEMGYEVIFITEKSFVGSEYSLPEGVEIIVIPQQSEIMKSKDYLKRAQMLQEIIENKEIDAVCYHEASSSVLFYDFLVYKKNSVNFIVVKHEYISQCMAGLSDTLYSQKSVFPLVDKVIVLSNAEKLFWEKMGASTEYIYNPVGKYALNKERNAKKKNEKIILWIGRLESLQKQYQDIVPIMKKVIRKVPDAVLKVYGSESDKGAIEKLNNMILSENMKGKVEYCGYITENVDDVYANASVHLVTSVYESFPMVIYESRINGIPLVLYQMPYLEMLKDNKGYIAVDNDDIEGAADAIVRILTDDSLRRQMSMEALESVKVFDSEKLKYRWKTVFDSFLVSTRENCNVECEEENTMKIIFDTMLYHYHKGCIFYQNRLIEGKENHLRDKVTSLLSLALKNKKLPIAIYPYGKLGKQVKQILNDVLNIQEAFVVDNNVAQDDIEVKRVEQLKDIDCSEYWFLICSNNGQCYDEIRQCLYEVVPFENGIDLFPRI